MTEFTIYTIQMGRWRKAKSMVIPLIDTTVKSGIPAFAPTWDMVKGIKEKTMSEEEYREKYLELLRESYHTHRDEWMKLLNENVVALACYCGAPPTFCHRHILKEVLIKLHQNAGHVVEDGGEIT